MKSGIAALALLAAISITASAQDGAAIYKSKCATCHGAEGQGKGKASPKVAGTTKSEDEIVALLTKGGEKKAPHIKPIAAMNADQAKAVAAYVKSLK
jgi:mono/diheme cytochrome c family protein